MTKQTHNPIDYKDNYSAKPEQDSHRVDLAEKSANEIDWANTLKDDAPEESTDEQSS